MHPPRRKRTTDHAGTADRLVEWLIAHCPFSTLAILSTLVISPIAGPVADPLVVAIPVVAADVAFFAMRKWTS